jgi:hydroxyacylglutathione hydrolase
MLLKYFYDQSLAHASYLVGCQKTGEAIVIDPARDVDQYLTAAKAEGLQIVGAAETHIHADFVSGARELAARVGAKLYLSDEGPAEWKYTYTDGYRVRLLKHGDTFLVGKLSLQAIHTPGHTPEHLAFLLTDVGGGADAPMGMFTGDFIFVNAIGRPDLLETAAGFKGAAERGARQLFRSVEEFKQLPDYLQIWPAHGAGSACGKGLGAIPSSTVGYEKLFNPALQFENEAAFVEYILADQPETPTYFKIMKRVNKEGPELLNNKAIPVSVTVESVRTAIADKRMVIDTRHAAAFAKAHVPGSINIPEANLATWAGWFVDYEQPLLLISEPTQRAEVARVLHKIGIDRISAFVDASEVVKQGLATQSYKTINVANAVEKIESGAMQVIDVRATTEWDAGHIPQAEHYFLGRLPQHVLELNNRKPIIVHCRTQSRSAIAASVLQAAGLENVLQLTGGFNEWEQQGLSIVRDTLIVA